MQNAFRTPGQLSEMNRQRNRRQPPRSRRSATHGQRNPIAHFDRERHNRTIVRNQYSLVRLQHQVIFDSPAPLRISARSGNRKLIGRLGVQLKIKIQSDGNRVKSGS